jgi:hypothetical protein
MGELCRHEIEAKNCLSYLTLFTDFNIFNRMKESE